MASSSTPPPLGCCAPTTRNQCAPSSACWDTYAELGHSVRTGQPAGDRVSPGGFWAYFSERPEEWSIFNEAMSAKAHGQVAAIVAAYDFSSFKVIGDIGGGRGHLLRAVLEQAPNARGILFDLPRVIAEAGDLGSERLNLQAGDFFKDSLPAGDAYLLMDISTTGAMRNRRPS